ncbi:MULTISPECIES: hypothetical protein [Vibrio]|uniref:Uncharacterized protein n=1 Tax=Vibrio hyugaensis TaxID=1534743 RepID=A0ABQ5YAZ9_9VIBR|nr:MULTISPECIES: hypothetical protein [Vibrio]ANQ59213.1 hypothetical protein AB831_24170 [Vibrio parahaemolyticus]ASO14442.1 hypothetical protein BGM07_008660 [Vibrio parahaemolyticus]AWA92303.1 hypothetical protein BSG32_25250 [Vibrio parahaemolyticus]EGQ7715731.1 hypothetical protein [Vibrio parahaemolyticus]EGQ7719553.1 hypothetical protein [Vibrio parahaemolyticus]
MRKILLSITLLLISAKAIADIEVVSKVVPRNLHVYDFTGNTFVDLKAHGCSGSRYHLSPNHPKYDAIFSVLLAAQLAEKTVSVRYDGCVNGSNAQGSIIGVYLD